jgi:hypothetical protein
MSQLYWQQAGRFPYPCWQKGEILSGEKHKLKPEAKAQLNAGQWVGLAIMAVAITVPAIFWGISYWRDITNTYCEGECPSGWVAVGSTLLAIPSLAIGAAILGIATALKNGKAAKKESS